MAGPLALPASSVAVAVRSAPSSWTGSSGVVKLPSSSTSAEPITSPLPSVMVTVLPGSPVPVSSLPSVASSTGASGAMVSLTLSAVKLLSLPASSVTVRVAVSSPSARSDKSWPATVSVVPSTVISAGSTVTEPPSPSVMTSWTLLLSRPFSMVPVRVTLPISSAFRKPSPPSSKAMLLSASAGAEASTVAVAGPLALPAPSVAIAVNSVPSCCSGDRSRVKLPSSSTVDLPTISPLLFVTVMDEPGSPVPVRAVPSEFSSSGAAGGRVSMVIMNASEASLTLPLGSVATAVRLCSPSAKGSGNSKDQLPSPSASMVSSRVSPS